ncbi:MAG TPA: hypothetical protein VIK62_00520 [Verrucomicrobiae bacterium]
MGKIQSTATGDEKFSADGGLGIVERHGRAARRRDFRRAQTSRPATNDRNFFNAKLKQIRSSAAPGCGRRLGLLFFLLLGFFFVTVISFGHIELLIFC